MADPTVTLSIRYVPKESHEKLVARAEAKGQSLQEYLLSLVQEHTARATRHEVLARARARRVTQQASPSSPFADLLQESRDERDLELANALGTAVKGSQ